MHAERRLGKSGDVWSAVIQRRSDPGNGAKTTIRTGLIGIRLEQSQEAGLSGDSGELSFNGNHWETLPCAQSIKTRLMPSYCVALDTAFMPTPRQKKGLVECKETLAIVAACRETEASMNTTLLPTTAAAHGQAGNQPHTAQCQRCNVTLYRPYVAGAFQPITKTHCPACEEYLALVAVAKAASQFERAAAAMTHTSDFCRETSSAPITRHISALG